MELGMTPTPEIHVADKPFIAQQFLFSNLRGNPRGQCAEQIKNGAANVGNERRQLLRLFSPA
jgi:hypothetical protein